MESYRKRGTLLFFSLYYLIYKYDRFLQVVLSIKQLKFGILGLINDRQCLLLLHILLMLILCLGISIFLFPCYVVTAHNFNRRVGYLLASGSDDCSFRIWDLRNFKAYIIANALYFALT